jgi:adenosine deaminase
MHLDGSIRPATMLELARERDVAMPAETAETLADYMLVSDAASLEEYLERFAVTLSVMQDAQAIERIAYECVIDHAREQVRYVEVRFCPLLNTEMGLMSDEVLDAALRGMRRAEQDAGAPAGVRSQLIVCALRSHTAARTLEMAELAVAYRDRGVCGFDIAGAEAGNPVADHADAFEYAHAAGLPITIHAGEGFGSASIRQALELGHASRIGHGTRLHEDPALQDAIRERGIPLEVCLTSNVQTRVADSVAAHPAIAYVEDGIPVALGTDNRLMSGVDLSDEYASAAAAFGLDRTAIIGLARTAFEHAFVAPAERMTLLKDFDRAVAAL